MWDPDTLPPFDSSGAHPGNPDSIVTDWSIDPDDWGYFLCKIWDDWYGRDIGKVFVNLFETAAERGWARSRSSAFIASSAARAWRWNTMAACTRAITTSIPNTSSGTSCRPQVREWSFPPGQRNSASTNSTALARQCRECNCLFACHGECAKNQLIRTPAGEVGLNYLCSGLQKFWHHTDRDVQDICRHMARGESLKPG